MMPNLVLEKKFSTQSSLHRLTEYLYNSLNNSHIVGLVALDLKKAFDTVDHKILLEKLHYYEIENKELCWFESYLSNRSQIPCINGTLSDAQTITTGVFILYINDITSCLKHSTVNMYADDTCFYISSTKIEYVISTLQEDIDHIYEWLCANRLSLNVQKTECMIICNYQKRGFLETTELNLQVNNEALSQTDHCKYLGTTIDSNLNFKQHISDIILKCNKAIGVMKRCSNYIPSDTLKNLYNTLMLPHLDYCSTTL